MAFTDLRGIETPAAVIDLEKLTRNTVMMGDRAHALGVRLRPHVKTHKCVEAARLQVAGHFGGVTVSTLAEVEYFAGGGFTDITYAVPLAPSKAGRVWQLNERIPSLQVLVDHRDAVEALLRAAGGRTEGLNILVKVDCGYGRAGLRPDDPELVSIAGAVHRSGPLRMMGVLAHGGHSYDCIDRAAVQRVAEQERSETVRAAQRLRAEGIPVDVVSVGSTPTACAVQSLDGVTELRPGNYALFDVFQSAIGSCELGDIALSVVSEVIGVYPERGVVLIDAGALALSKDPGATHVKAEHHFGRVCTLDGLLIDGVSLVGLSQEHGKIRLSPGAGEPRLGVGDRVRILPNHSCLVAALHAQLHVARGHTVVDSWAPVRGW